MTDLNALKFPIGEFTYDEAYSAEERSRLINEIAAAPAQLRAAVEGLNEGQLDTQYRPDGWTLRQVVHHLADSHINSYIRFRLALTEDEPSIRPYFEDRWARLEDAQHAPVELSLTLVGALHERWALLLHSLEDSHFQMTYFHPEAARAISLDEAVGTYAWHGKHHIAHITSLREREGW
ncbi:MAG: bacillithiol transferase BstA [Candidatus Hinthialibacter antarcticus]|nr:bacillithiol transferase BstA [Candidatus Hinthialibacter antarcticus]